jgi:hypothetical protein
MIGIAMLSSRISENSKGVMNLRRSPQFWSLFNDDHGADVNPEVAEDADVGAEIELVMKSFAGACSIARRRK